MKNKHPIPSISELRKIFSYDQRTGLITWIKGSLRWPSGRVAGSFDKGTGYIIVTLRSTAMRGHRLAWALHYGEWPEDEIDHINGIRNDNRVENMRNATRETNNQNIRTATKANASGILGVRFKGGSWMSSIRVKGRAIHLGSFGSAEAAHQAYVDAKRVNHPGCTI